MQALILAGGLGTRLRLVVDGVPKGMTKFDNKYFLEYQIEFLKSYGIFDIVMCVGYLNQFIQEYFSNGSRWNVKIHYSVEEKLVGTAGALKFSEELITGTFLVLNGDSFLDVELDKIIQFHQEQRSGTTESHGYLGTLALTTAHDVSSYGSVKLDEDNKITSFVEKSSELKPYSSVSHLINAGIYVLEPKILDFVPSQRKVSIEKETFPGVLNKGYELGGYLFDGFFVDIGTPAGHDRFKNYLMEKIR